MRFMCMHKVDAKMEAGERPSPKIIQEMGQFVGGLLKSGVFKDGGGLHRSALRARVNTDGSVERGPYQGRNELICGFALISTGAQGIERAIALAKDLGKAAGGREVEVGPLVEGWDLNGSARPADAPHRFLLLVKGEADAQPAAMRDLLDRWKSEGLLQSEAALKPSKNAARSKVIGGKRTWLDGPFAESKELIAGFAILELPSLEEAKALTKDYVAILGDNECDIREVA